VLNQAGDLSGKVVITCCLPMNDNDNGTCRSLQPRRARRNLQKKIPKARVVLAFNTVPNEVLFSVYVALGKANRPSLVYCGDDRSAKELAAGLISDVGFDSGGCWPAADCPITSSRLRCLSDNSHTREKKSRNWLTISSGLENRISNKRQMISEI